MRRFFDRPGISTCLVVSIAMLSAAVVSRPPADAFAAAGSKVTVVPVVQSQTGVASGTTQTLVYFDPIPQLDYGTYVSTGQLGRGRYAFRLTFGPSLCGHGDFKVPVSGTATLTRSDATRVSGTVTGTEDCDGGPDVPTATTLDVVLTHGARDLIGANLQFTGSLVRHFDPSGTGGYESFTFAGTSSATTRVGYAMVDANGKMYAFGGIDRLGDAPTAHAVDIERTPSGKGYWIANNAGQVFAFGDARYLGGADMSAFLSGQRITSISSTPTGKGYWLFTTDGRALRFGDAQLFGDLHSTVLNGGIVGSIATPTGKGYYMVGSDGGVFAFGDARFRGSMGNVRLNQPVVELVPAPNNDGYWLVAADGGVFSFNAPFHGSTGAIRLNRPIVAMVPFAGAYLMVATDGGVFNFSNGPFFGSEGSTVIPVPIVNGAAIG